MTKAGKQQDASGSGKRTIQRIDYKNLFKTIEGKLDHTNVNDGAGTTSPSNQHHNSPTHHNLSYHQQQQIHQQQIQRIGGLQRLTADLAGLQFNDADALLKNLPLHKPTVPARRPAPKQHVTSPRTNILEQLQHQQAQPVAAPVKQEQQQPSPTQQLQPPPQPPQPLAQVADEDSVSRSEGSDHDPVKDAQETAEDAMVLKRYRILGLVGTGNYARVYKATVPPNSKEVAVKAINLNRTSDNYKQKFLPRELTILRKISHVNICKVYEIIQIADRIFIVMQFCNKGTIADLLQKNGPFSEALTRHLFVPTIDAIVYLHNIEIAHRDIKVENILLDHEYVPKLTDFSYSVSQSDKCNTSSSNNPSSRSAKTSKNQVVATMRQQQQLLLQQMGSRVRLNDTFCGTLPYLSPEMIRQFPYDCKKTDMWSLGVCFFVMLNDRLPFPFNDIRSMIKKQLAKDYKFKANIDISEQCKDLMSQLLEPDFMRRIGGLEASRHPWMAGARERPRDH